MLGVWSRGSARLHVVYSRVCMHDTLLRMHTACVQNTESACSCVASSTVPSIPLADWHRPLEVALLRFVFGPCSDNDGCMRGPLLLGVVGIRALSHPELLICISSFSQFSLLARHATG